MVGGKSGGGTPGPISNPVVKPTSVDGSGGAAPCERRPSPTTPPPFFSSLSLLFASPFSIYLITYRVVYSKQKYILTTPNLFKSASDAFINHP